MCGDVIVEKARTRPLRGEGGGLVLRSPHDTEADVAVAADGRAEGALRRAAVVGVEVPVAAAH